MERLEDRVAHLEAEVDRLRRTVTGPPPPPPPPPRSALPAPPGRPPTRQAAERTEVFALESETVLKWGGVGLVVLAVGFAVSTAIRRGWIGPELQLFGAVGVSLALIAVGLRLRPERPLWAHALCSGGVAALFTTVASDLFLDQTSDNIAFTCTVVIGLGGYLLARHVPSEWVGAVALVGGLVGWVVIADEELPFHATLGWVVALVAIALALAVEQKWFGLRFLAHGLGLVGAMALAGDAETGSEQLLVLTAALLLYLSLVRLPSIGDMKTDWQKVETQLAMVVGPWALAVIEIVFDMEDETVIGAVGIAVAVATFVVAMALRPWIHRLHFISLLVSASVSLSIGLAFLLSTTAVFVGLSVQGVGLVLFGRSLGGSVRVSINAAALMLISAVFVFVQMIEAWSEDASIGDDIGHLVIIVAIAVAGWLTNERATQQLAAAGVLGLTLVWLGSVLVHLPQGQAAVSLSWAVVGTAVLVTGAVRKVPELGAVGLGVLALTVAKLLTVDLREVDALWRAALFFAIGLGIMRLGFLLPRLTGVEETTRGSQAVDEPVERPVNQA